MFSLVPHFDTDCSILVIPNSNQWPFSFSLVLNVALISGEILALMSFRAQAFYCSQLSRAVSHWKITSLFTRPFRHSRPIWFIHFSTDASDGRFFTGLPRSFNFQSVACWQLFPFYHWFVDSLTSSSIASLTAALFCNWLLDSNLFDNFTLPSISRQFRICPSDLTNNCTFPPGLSDSCTFPWVTYFRQ